MENPKLKILLARHGIRPRKRLGQHFMADANFARAVAKAAAPLDGKTLVLEVGPGAGALTRVLLESHPRLHVLAVELDPRLVNLLREAFAAEIEAGRLTLIEGDVLQGKHGLNPEWLAEGWRISEAEGRPRRVLCANLPYNIATPLMANLALPSTARSAHRRHGQRIRPSDTARNAGGLLEAPFVERVVATVQLELAKRLFGKPGSSDYSALAAFLALRARGSILRKAGPEVFWPKPRVASAVVGLELPPWCETHVSAGEAAAFLAFMQQLFQQRRKTLRALLKGRLEPDDPRAARRAEALAPEELLALFRKISE